MKAHLYGSTAKFNATCWYFCGAKTVGWHRALALGWDLLSVWAWLPPVVACLVIFQSPFVLNWCIISVIQISVHARFNYAIWSVQKQFLVNITGLGCALVNSKAQFWPKYAKPARSGLSGLNVSRATAAVPSWGCFLSICTPACPAWGEQFIIWGRDTVMIYPTYIMY